MDGDIRGKFLKNGLEGIIDDEEVNLKLGQSMEWDQEDVGCSASANFTFFSMFGINVVSQAFIGHIGSTELAAYALVFTVLRFSNGIFVSI